MAQGVLSQVLDALDLETFLICSSEDEGKEMAIRLMKTLGFQDVDLVFIQFAGPGARVRARAYIYRPGQDYAWVRNADREGKG
ncbi:hypothetical protein GTO91_10585 [Heliobacterium undosum]|uniref:Uncharacterized protein n=1 Tax=Heliomicrobium undosum TaxID=121734 RepID=A0A845L5N5_9FIRM|nr:hypothetical protein [Heliomicrobium undosum]MZP30154.1 hypothetical protein [Heliomicrobium undosum]